VLLKTKRPLRRDRRRDFCRPLRGLGECFGWSRGWRPGLYAVACSGRSPVRGL